MERMWQWIADRARFALAAVFCACAAPAGAAPFCVTTASLPPQCLYVDPGNCRTRAAELHGVCTANPFEVPLTAGFGPYCVVDASRYTFCVYQDLASCSQAANRQRGSICVMAAVGRLGGNH